MITDCYNDEQQEYQAFLDIRYPEFVRSALKILFANVDDKIFFNNYHCDKTYIILVISIRVELGTFFKCFSHERLNEKVRL